jgi:hypothetical protein
MAYVAAMFLQPLDAWRAVGGGVVALLFVLSAYLFATRSEFRFDATARKVHWYERRPFSSAAGTLGFDALTGISVQRDNGVDGAVYRVVLHASDADLPLTRHYSNVEPHAETAQRITDWLHGHGVRVGAVLQTIS